MKYVGYIRVSTKDQGDSGLGLDAQKEQIINALGEPACWYIEVVSGRKKKRDVLMQALDYCKEIGATLVVTKVDRLVRSMEVGLEVRNSGIPLHVVECPEMNTFMFYLFCALAEQEAEWISERTKAGLKQAKARGVALGSARPGHWDGRQRGCPRHSKIKPVDHAIKTQCDQLRASGCSYQSIADKLNAQGHRAPKGGHFTKSQIHRIVHHA